MPNSKEIIKLKILSERYGYSFIRSAVGANRRLSMDRHQSGNRAQRDTKHQGDYCRICLTDELRDSFNSLPSAIIPDGGKPWLLLLNNYWGLHVAGFRPSLYEPKKVKNAKQQHRNYQSIEFAAVRPVRQLGFNGFGIPDIVESVYPPLCQYRFIGLFYEKVNGLIVALHLIEQDKQGIIDRVILHVPGAFADIYGETLPPVPPIIPSVGGRDASEIS